MHTGASHHITNCASSGWPSSAPRYALLKLFAVPSLRVENWFDSDVETESPAGASIRFVMRARHAGRGREGAAGGGRAACRPSGRQWLRLVAHLAARTRNRLALSDPLPRSMVPDPRTRLPRPAP